METNQRPSSWVNLQEYLDLNRDQADEMGNKLNQSLREQGQAARQQVRKASTAFQKQAGEGAFVDPNAKDPSGRAYNTMSAPTAAKAQQLAATEYKGPRQLSDVAPDVGTAVGDAMVRLNAAKTAGGAATLMQDAAKSPSSYYGSTAGGLDAVLAGQSAANASLAATQAEFGGLAKELGVASQQAGEFGDKMYGQHEAARNAYRAMVPGLQEQEAATRSGIENRRLGISQSRQLREAQERREAKRLGLSRSPGSLQERLHLEEQARRDAEDKAALDRIRAEEQALDSFK